jgi:SAM-dependent methyltransferase
VNQRLRAGLLAAAACATACSRGAPNASHHDALLRYADFDGVARKFLLERTLFGEGLRKGGDAAEESFQSALAELRAADDRRVAGAFDYDLPALVRYVLAPPLPPRLDVDWLAHVGDPNFERAAAFARGESGAPGAGAATDPVFAAARHGDPLGLRPFLLQNRLTRSGKDPKRATGADVAAEFAAVNRFLDDEQQKLEQHQESPEIHFLDWFLKTTTLTGLPPKIGLITEELLAALSTQPPASVHRVLVVGPGVDLASPHLGALAPVVMYQPFEIADTLRRLHLAAPDCEVDALDVNPRVLDVLDQARRAAETGGALRLVLFRGAGAGRLVLDGVEPYLNRLFSSFDGSPGFSRGTEQLSLSPDVALRAAAEIRRNFAAAFARSGGPTPDEQKQFAPLLQRIELEARIAWRTVDLPPAAVLPVHPLSGDVVTDRFAATDRYDLVLCTNVLVYFPPQLQALALLNLRRATRKGGLLLCTDLFVEKEGEEFCGWRLEKSARHLDFDPQHAYRCLKPR